MDNNTIKDRKDLRYKLFRIQNGNPDESHLDLLNVYDDIDNFSISWDVDFEGNKYKKTGIAGRLKDREINKKLGR